MATYFFALEGYNSSTVTIAHKYNNETGVWTTVAAPPTISQGQGASATTSRQEGGWDGNYWYVLLMDGKLYRYDPTGNTWSSALAAGQTFVALPVSGQVWYMESDGRFMYIWSTLGFRRYDPVADSVLDLQDLAGGTFGRFGCLEYDGNDILYASRGGASQQNWQKYTISTATWTTLANFDGGTNTIPKFFAYLGGRAWRLEQADGNGGFGAHMFMPSGTVGQWIGKSGNTPGATIQESCVYGEIDDSTLRIWNLTNGSTAVDYNIAADTWITGPPSSWTQSQGGSFAVARVFNPSFTWYLSDGTTLAGASVNLGAVVVGDTIAYQLKVKTPVARGSGVRVAVPQLPTTDAEDPVTICGTAGGTYGTTFDTAALTANQFFDVFLRVTPTTTQTLGFTKTFNLQVTTL